ncbi:MAG TPA: hypothetical protein VGZ47_05630 [Gemmataceae bacterium]|jgi:hypothetical protein|nr:hypothetical protein [Gemmataceae bacterium]
MWIGFPPSAEDSRQYDLSTRDLLHAIEDALYDLRWPHFRDDRFRVVANISGQIFVSYGEKVTIDIEREGWVRVRSECSFPLQWMDWGKNAGNVRQFFARLEDIIDEGSRPRKRRRRDDDYDE